MSWLSEAANRLGMRGVLVHDVRFAATSFVASVKVDEAERARRRDAGLGAVVSHELLEVLAVLPHGHPVDWNELDPVSAAVLDLAPDGVVARTPRSVERLWRPAITLEGVLVIDTNPSEGLDAASLFAPDAARALILERLEEPPAWVEREAQELGVGLAVIANDRFDVKVRPQPSPAAPSSPRHWRLRETIYANWLLPEAYSSAHVSK